MAPPCFCERWPLCTPFWAAITLDSWGCGSKTGRVSGACWGCRNIPVQYPIKRTFFLKPQMQKKPDVHGWSWTLQTRGFMWLVKFAHNTSADNLQIRNNHAYFFQYVTVKTNGGVHKLPIPIATNLVSGSRNDILARFNLRSQQFRQNATIFVYILFLLLLLLLWTHAQRGVHVIFCRCFFHLFLWPP